VTKAHRYEPDLNPTYQDMAAHYGIAIVPTRARKPRDYVAPKIMCWSRTQASIQAISKGFYAT